jgi:hypothetical protein
VQRLLAYAQPFSCAAVSLSILALPAAFFKADKLVAIIFMLYHWIYGCLLTRLDTAVNTP